MNLPPQIDVGFKPVAVLRSSPHADPDEGGYWSEQRREMFVDTGTPDHEQGLATLHEIVHMGIDEHDIEIPLKLEERICDAVSRTLAEIIVRNPTLLPLIAEALK